MGDEEDDLSYDDCVGGLKVLRTLRNWSRANNREKKSVRVAEKLKNLSAKLQDTVCGAYST